MNSDSPRRFATAIVHTNTPPTPDWEKQHLYIVDPRVRERYWKGRYDVRPVFADLHEASRALGIEDEVLTRSDSPLDIWIRDWGFVEGCYFGYNPSYARGYYKARPPHSPTPVHVLTVSGAVGAKANS